MWVKRSNFSHARFTGFLLLERNFQSKGCAMTRQKKPPLTNAERCRRWRLKLAEADSERFQREREANKDRARQNRQKQKTPEQLQRRRELGLERQKRYLAKKAAEEAARVAEGAPTPRRTRFDAEKAAKRREANRLAVQKHRSLQSTQMQRRVREKRKAYYHRKNAENSTEIEKTRRGISGGGKIVCAPSQEDDFGIHRAGGDKTKLEDFFAHGLQEINSEQILGSQDDSNIDSMLQDCGSLNKKSAQSQVRLRPHVQAAQRRGPDHIQSHTAHSFVQGRVQETLYYDVAAKQSHAVLKSQHKFHDSAPPVVYPQKEGSVMSAQNAASITALAEFAVHPQRMSGDAVKDDGLDSIGHGVLPTQKNGVLPNRHPSGADGITVGGHSRPISSTLPSTHAGLGTKMSGEQRSADSMTVGDDSATPSSYGQSVLLGHATLPSEGHSGSVIYALPSSQSFAGLKTSVNGGQTEADGTTVGDGHASPASLGRPDRENNLKSVDVAGTSYGTETGQHSPSETCDARKRSHEPATGGNYEPGPPKRGKVGNSENQNVAGLHCTSTSTVSSDPPSDEKSSADVESCLSESLSTDDENRLVNWLLSTEGLNEFFKFIKAMMPDYND